MEDRETHETTEISARIRDHKQGKITDAELVKYLTEEVKYKPGNVNPYTPGTGEWFLWSEGGKPYLPGSFQEVVKARDTGTAESRRLRRGHGHVPPQDEVTVTPSCALVARSTTSMTPKQPLVH